MCRQHWETLWTFKTRRFTVDLAFMEEDQPDLSWMDDEDREKIRTGEWFNACFRVRLLLDGRELAADHLGNSVYANVHEFYLEHFGIRALSRKDGRAYGCYFSDMVANVIAEARKELSHPPQLRAA